MSEPYKTSWYSKEDKKAYNEQYYLEHKERLKHKALLQPAPLITCTCGMKLMKKNLKRHLQSKAHSRE